MTERRDTREIHEEYTDKNKKSTEDITKKIQEELAILSNKGKRRPADIIALFNKYPDNDTIVEEVLRLDAKRRRRIKDKALKVAKKIVKKYGNGERPLHEILDRLIRYKTKNKWTDEQFEEFRRILFSLLSGKRALEIDYNQNLEAYRSRINRTLGDSCLPLETGLRLKDSEHGVLGEILSLYQKFLVRHRQVFMHSLMYEDCSLVAMTGEYKRDRHIASNYIHPLIACMFLPKFEIFEMFMIYANFGSIIKTKYDKEEIVTEPDLLLFYAITSDPNDVVCEINSPLADLKNRFLVQISLWNTILKLRYGNYYEDEPISEFINMLNACRNNLYDNADLVYNQDEGALLRRLMSVFSLRPTFIYTRPIYSVASFFGNMYSFGMNMGSVPNSSPGMWNTFPFQNQPTYTVTNIPMIVLQIPPFTVGAEPKDIRTANSQILWINENKNIVPKEQSILYSKEIIIFYVNRRIQRIQIRTFSNPLTFSQLPLTMTNFDKLNAYPVNVPDRVTFGRSEETYYLRSIVAVTETEIVQSDKVTNIITGCTGLIMTHRNFERTIFEPAYYLYDPFGASLPVEHPDSDGSYFTNKPISRLPATFGPIGFDDDRKNESFYDRARSTGTVYFYAKSSGYNASEIISL